MTSVIQKIARMAHQAFSRKMNDDSLNQLKSCFASVTAEDIDFNGEAIEKRSDLIAPAIFMDIYNTPIFTLSLFAVREGQKLPLHDHPGMYGLIRVIHGTFQVKSYTRLDPQTTSSPPDEMKSRVSSFFSRFRRYKNNGPLPAILSDERTVSASDQDVCVLTPDDRNIHELTSLASLSAFVDILAPPYEDGVRDCHFYTILGVSFDQKLGREVTWLVETEAPLSYWSKEIPYTGPSISL